jgi:hypothetical protein
VLVIRDQFEFCRLRGILIFEIEVYFSSLPDHGLFP